MKAISKVFFCILIALALGVTNTFGQGKALTFQEAERLGIPLQHLDSLYKSAVHDDSSLAVFKTAEEQAQVLQAYTKLLQEFGNFLKENNFKWEHPIRGFNRIYMRPDGGIDYFLYNFPPDQLKTEKAAEFARLLNLFVQDYRFGATADEKFAQCSPVRYADN